MGINNNLSVLSLKLPCQDELYTMQFMYLLYCKHRISEKCCVLVNMLNLCSILYNLRKKQCALPKVNTE